MLRRAAGSWDEHDHPARERPGRERDDLEHEHCAGLHGGDQCASDEFPLAEQRDVYER